MHTYKIKWVELKKVTVGGVEKEIYEGTFTNNLGSDIQATIWKFDKENIEFPGWSEIRPGGEVTGNPWTKPGTTKVTIYPPSENKPRGGAPSAYKGKQIEEAQVRKNEMIGKTMDRKEESIALAGAQRDAVLIVTTMINTLGKDYLRGVNPGENLGEDMKEQIIKWRNWFLSEDFRNPPPF